MRIKIESREDFLDLVDKRVNSATDSLRLIGKLSSNSDYPLTDSEISVIEDYLAGKFDAMRKALRSPNGAPPQEFTIKG